MKFYTTKHHSTNTAALLVATLAVGATAFAPVHHHHHQHGTRPTFGSLTTTTTAWRPTSTTLHMSTTTSTAVDEEVTRLRTMAAKLRAEVASLEDEQRQSVQAAATRAFDRLDANGDGAIDLDELKAGLEKIWKTSSLPADRVQELMNTLDTSGDGVLQRDEMRNIEQLRNQWDALERHEKEVARNAARQAQQEKQEQEQKQAVLALVNDGEPTTQDKIVSVLPYLFPLLDGLQFVAPWIVHHADNPVAQAAAVAYGLYRSIPFGGFLAFLALTTLSGNLGLNRLIRFNMQQAIFLDIAMFVPTLALTLINALGSATGVGGLSENMTELVGEAFFAVLALNILYATTSSLLLGQAPDKIPFLSKAVQDRLPTADDIIVNMDEFNKNKKQDDDKQ